MLNAQSEEQNYPKNVGDIQFNSKIDDPNFKTCIPDFSFQYYNFSKGFQYKGEKYELLKLWKESNKLNFQSSKKGYITVRFLVNCEGQTGLFRVQQMDEDYNETIFEENIVSIILKFVKSLDGWIVQSYKGQTVDYYQYLTFKIENGIVKEILP